MSTPPAGGETRELADVVRATVLAVPGVAALSAGALGTVATYLPGRRVGGVAVRDDGSVEVAVVAALHRGLQTDLVALAAAVSAAVSPLVPGPVRVTIDDLAVG